MGERAKQTGNYWKKKKKTRRRGASPSSIGTGGGNPKKSKDFPGRRNSPVSGLEEGRFTPRKGMLGQGEEERLS